MNDETLREQILAIFAADNRLVHAGLRVGVLNGVAHLAGTADSLAARAVAEQLAGTVPGVRGIVNRIEAPGAPRPSRVIHLELSPDEKDLIE